MPTHVIQDADDPRLAVYLRLKDRDVRRETGLFLAEGEHVVRRAFAAAAAGQLPGVRSVLVVESKVDRVEAMIAEALPGAAGGEVEVLACAKDVIERAVGFQMHQGIIAACEPPVPPELGRLLAELPGSSSSGGGGGNSGGTVVVCPEITNVDNLGLLVRVCAALGVRAMVLGPRCADPWYRRAVRVSMGAVFSLPMVLSEDIPADLERLRGELGYELLATVIDADAQPLREVEVLPGAGEKRAVLLGSEGYGLPKKLVAACDRKVRIPMHADIDSLNVAVAAGIIIHHVCRT